MLTVRYPNGQTIVYNDANFLYYKGDDLAWELYTNKERTKWIASIQVSSGAIIEYVSPCKIYNTNENKFGTLTDEVATLTKEVRKLSRKIK